MLAKDVRLQREYYERTAHLYENLHVGQLDEHQIALAAFSGFLSISEHAAVLDVGAGTGRAVRFLMQRHPNTRVVGVEPVKALRDIGMADGNLPAGSLVEGDATDLHFADDEFEWTVETGVLHHIRDARAAVREMCRVARVGIMLSDANNVGQGSSLARTAKRLIRALGLWPAVVAIQTRGRMYKESDTDGIYYSFSIFDVLHIVRQKFPHVHLMNTKESGADLYGSAEHLMVIAWR